MTKKVIHPNRSIVTAMLVFCVLLGLYFVKLKAPQLMSADASTATMVISFDDQSHRAFRGPVTEDMTILDALFAATQGTKNLNVVYSMDSNNNVNLSSINQYNNSPTHGWVFRVDGRSVRTEDINKVFVRVGDTLEVKYQ